MSSETQHAPDAFDIQRDERIDALLATQGDVPVEITKTLRTLLAVAYTQGAVDVTEKRIESDALNALFELEMPF